jgi:NAD(P)-dependent dehydrogenase (short-subunit alcohol dehydrogenase family)
MIDINLKSAILFSKFLAHKKFFKPNSSAVFISSVMGVKGAKGQSIYSASKGGLISFVKSLALELSSSNIRVNCISPGVVKSPMLNRYKKTVNLESFNDLVNSHPIGIGNLSDVSNLINFLFSDESKWITGQNIIIDGGFSS